jgi:hypothetical protein
VYGGEWQLSVLPQVTVPRSHVFINQFLVLLPAADRFLNWMMMQMYIALSPYQAQNSDRVDNTD